MPYKCIMILLDGVGDRSHAVLGHRTPLQAAPTPVLDGLAGRGANGLYHAGMLGQAFASENAHFSMFGYDRSDFPGRGPLEALGAGMDLNPEDVAVLAHFVELRRYQGCLFLEKGKPGIDEQEVGALRCVVEYFEKNGVSVCFRPTSGAHGIITLSGNVAPFFTDSDPFIDGRPLIHVTPWASHSEDSAAVRAADAVKHYLIWSHERLEKHPVNRSRRRRGEAAVNGLVSQRSGQLRPVLPFVRQNGLKGLSIASGRVYAGLAKYLDMGFEKVADTGDPCADMAECLMLARKALKDYNFIHVHSKAPDEAAHAKDPELKKSVIASLDRGIGKAVGPLMDDPEVLVVIVADHATPSAGPLIHSGEPVPVTFVGTGVRQDQVRHFDEVSAASGALGLIRGKELMYLILNALDRAKLQGVMDTPTDQPFWPGSYEPFRVI